MNPSTRVGLLLAVVLLSRSMSQSLAHPLEGFVRTGQELTKSTTSEISSEASGGSRGYWLGAKTLGGARNSRSKNKMQAVQEISGKKGSREIEDEDSYVWIDSPRPDEVTWYQNGRTPDLKAPRQNRLGKFSSQSGRTPAPQAPRQNRLEKTSSQNLLVNDQKLKAPIEIDTRNAIIGELEKAENKEIELDQKPIHEETTQVTKAEIEETGPTEQVEDKKTELAEKAGSRENVAEKSRYRPHERIKSDYEAFLDDWQNMNFDLWSHPFGWF